MRGPRWNGGKNGNSEIGVGLAAAAAPVFLMMSLLVECHRWSERALSALTDATRGGDEEMHLQAGFGIASMHIHGENDIARAALDRSLAIAEEHGDALNEAGLLGMLHMFHFRGGDFGIALHYAERCRTVAGSVADSAATALAHSILGRSLLMMGDINGARRELEALLRIWSPTQQSSAIYLVHDRHFRAGIALARTLWLQGYPARAVERVRASVEGAERMDHPASLTVLLAWAASIFLWTGDLSAAEQHVSSSIAIAESYLLGPLAAVGRARLAQLAICRGDARGGVASLRASLQEIHQVRYELITTEFNISLVQGLAALGQFADAARRLDEATRHVETKGDTCYVPELLRVKAGLLQSMAEPRMDEAETCLLKSLKLARGQGARGWELRAATDLAALWADRGQRERGRAVLEPVFAEFTEGFDTFDLKAAKSLLATLN